VKETSKAEITEIKQREVKQGAGRSTRTCDELKAGQASAAKGTPGKVLGLREQGPKFRYKGTGRKAIVCRRSENSKLAQLEPGILGATWGIKFISASTEQGLGRHLGGEQ